MKGIVEVNCFNEKSPLFSVSAILRSSVKSSIVDSFSGILRFSREAIVSTLFRPSDKPVGSIIRGLPLKPEYFVSIFLKYISFAFLAGKFSSDLRM